MQFVRSISRRHHSLPSLRRTTKPRIARHLLLPPPPFLILLDIVVAPWRLQSRPRCSKAPLRRFKHLRLLEVPQAAIMLSSIPQIIPYPLQSTFAVFVVIEPLGNIMEFTGNVLVQSKTNNLMEMLNSKLCCVIH